MVDEDRLTDRYVLESRIAIGGMGGVYVARDERLDRTVAVKVLKDSLVHDPRFVERFRREARAVAALSHPNVATVYDYGQEGERHFIVMELVEGRDLSRVLREEGPLEPERVAAVGAGVARALEHAHAAGVVHRDIKPANIMVSPGDRVKVTDFGIARATGESTLTATGSVMGTAQYISPEQASGEPVTPRSDIYSLWIVLFEMLTGSVPFTGDNALVVAMQHVNEEVPAPSSINRHVPTSLDALVERATRTDPNARFADAGALASDLETAAIELEAGGDTAELAEEEETASVWPIPGSRYDPEKLGRRVIGVLATLALIALVLLIWRIATVEPLTRAGEARGGAGATENAGGETTSPLSPEETAPPSPTSDEITLDDYLGDDIKEAEAALKGAGLGIAKEDVDHGSPKGTILSQSPEPGSVVVEGDTVTLTVSTGKAPESDDDDDEDPGKGKAKGKDKEDEEGDD